jgi:hypothetical protein
LLVTSLVWNLRLLGLAVKAVLVLSLSLAFLITIVIVYAQDLCSTKARKPRLRATHKTPTQRQCWSCHSITH